MRISLSLTWSDIIAIYAAALSSALAFRQWYLTRVLIEVSGFFTGDPQSLDIITIYNKSKRNIEIEYFGLFWTDTINGDRKEIETGREGYPINISIGAFASQNIEFPDQYKISFRRHKKLYITFRVRGKRSEVIKVIDC